MTSELSNPRLEARIVSLPHSLERRRIIAANLAALPFPWQFFDAADFATSTHLESSPSRQTARYGRALTAGELGCFKSHIAALATFDEIHTLEWLLVLEDDVALDVHFDFTRLLDVAQLRNIGFIRLFCRRWAPADVVGTIDDSHQLIRFRTDPYGSQAYLISRPAASRLRRVIRRIDRPIDDEYGRFWISGLELYAVFPFPVYERSLISTLSEGRKGAAPTRTSHTPKRLYFRFLDYCGKRVCNTAYQLKRASRAVQHRPLARRVQRALTQQGLFGLPGSALNPLATRSDQCTCCSSDVCPRRSAVVVHGPDSAP